MNNTKILIIEDETIVALDIKRIVKNLGYEVTDTVTNFESAINSVEKNRPDIILSDINLNSDKNGIDIIETIQKKDFIPTIYITAYSDELTIQRAIKTNPMGYILKPFRKDDIKSALLLTIYKLQNEKIEKNSSFIKLNDGYFYDLKNETLYYNTKPIKLSIKERQLLTILVEAKGNIVSFSDLEYLLWPDAPVSNSSLRTLVYRLRTKLEYKCIETISSIGCKILNSS
jgi:DNA-binding response OmpR family regulator